MYYPFEVALFVGLATFGATFQTSVVHSRGLERRREGTTDRAAIGKVRVQPQILGGLRGQISLSLRETFVFGSSPQPCFDSEEAIYPEDPLLALKCNYIIGLFTNSSPLLCSLDLDNPEA